MSTLRWAVVHAPEDAAVPAWTAAAAAVDVPQPRLVPWAEVLDGTAGFNEGELVHAERLTPVTPLRYGGSGERHEQFAAALGVLGERLKADGAEAAADPAETLLALDRRRCTEHLAASGVSAPGAGDQFARQRFAEPGDAVSQLRGNGSVVSTLRLVRTREGDELHHGLHGSYHEAGAIGEILARDGEIFTVGDLPTAYLNGEQYRFRFAVVDGRVTHAAGRLADTVLAREYFGGRRREIEAYHERFGAEKWQQVVALAERAATAFPGLRALGVDIAASQAGRPDVVYDIDPFGARLPAALGLPGGIGEGLRVQAAALRSRLSRPAG